MDMLRKIVLSGLLQFVPRGTAVQVFCGCVLAFGSFGVQLHVWPYKDHAANVLKMCADIQIFLTFLISFILHVMAADSQITAYEPLSAEFYGFLLLLSVVVILVLAMILTVKPTWRRWKFRAGLKADIASGNTFDDDRSVAQAASAGDRNEMRVALQTMLIGAENASTGPTNE